MIHNDQFMELLRELSLPSRSIFFPENIQEEFQQETQSKNWL